MAKRRRKARTIPWLRRLLTVLLVPLAIYLVAALAGALIPLNRNWQEPDTGTSIYLVDNGVHLDIAFPVAAGGLDWRDDFPGGDLAEPVWANAPWVMIGAGDRGIYTQAEEWADLTPGVALSALIAGERVMHVQYIPDPAPFAAAEIRLRPEEYRRLWQAVRGSFDLRDDGRPIRLDNDGYFASDAFYEGRGTFNALVTCNQWVATRLRIAGVETSLWSPFSKGLPWRFRAPDPAAPVADAR